MRIGRVGRDIWEEVDAAMMAKRTEDFALVIEGKCSPEDANDLLPKLLAELRASLAYKPELSGIDCRLLLRESAQQVKAVRDDD